MHLIDCPFCNCSFDHPEYEEGDCPGCGASFYYDEYEDEDGFEVNGYFWD